jgi:MFS family permease
MKIIPFIRWLCVLQQSSLSASRMVLTLYALQLDAPALVVGALVALFSFFPATLAVVAGRLVDRYGARWFLAASAAGSALGMCLPIALPSLASVLIAGALAGLSMVFYNVSLQSLTGLWSTPGTRGRNFSTYSMMTSAGGLIGPVIGGYAVDHFGYSIACATTGVLTLLTVVMLIFRRGNLEPASQRAVAPKGSIPLRETLAMLRDPMVRHTITTGCLLNSGMNIYVAYMPVYAHGLGMSGAAIGLILSSQAAAAFVARALLPRSLQWLKEEGVLVLAFVLGAASLVLLPLLHAPVMLGLLSFIFGLGMGNGQPIITMLTFQNSPPGRSGEGVGLKVTANHLTNMVSPLLFGGIATAVGLLPMFWVNGLLMAAGAWISRPKK